MKEEIGRSIGWGVGAFRLIMNNKIVTSAYFLIQGAFYLFAPVSSMRSDAGTIALMLALYALASIALVLCDRQTVSKGRDLAGGLLSGFFVKKKDLVAAEQTVLPKDTLMDTQRKVDNRRMDAIRDKVLEKHDETYAVCRISLLLFYMLLLTAAALLFFRKDVTIRVVHIVLGLLMIADGVLSIASVLSNREALSIKHGRLSVILACLSVILGLVFILFAWETAVLATQIIGAVLLIKSLAELTAAFRNREILSSAKETVEQIKSQGSGAV